MQEVLAASGQTQPVSFLSAITRSEMELEFLRPAEGVSVPCSCQALQAQQSFIPASTCRVTISPTPVCHVSWILVGRPAPLSTFSQAVTVPVQED